MDPREFKKSYESLKDDFRDAGANPQSFELKGCRNCGSCMFCTGCDFCYRCNYCEKCEGCSECTHCVRCSRSHTSAYCTDCDNCINSKYLDQCESCSDCTYCFGCVGLSRKDFHILNEPYGRNEYFRIVEKLKKQLRSK
ncbi:MAG: caib/baif family protein [Deltaproteobacteria bacterium]|nr:caib/baif family protein [Deltaproteobacteria bacterium]